MTNIITLSPNFTLDEFRFSETADKYNIPNDPNQDALDNLIALCTHVLQPLRDHIEAPITVTSGYRSPALNTKLKGSTSSQHLTGEAADIIVKHRSNKEIADYIRNNLIFDQLIYEYPDDDTGEIDWIHVSYSTEGNRMETLIAEKRYHRKTYQTVYYPYTDDYFDKYDDEY